MKMNCRSTSCFGERSNLFDVLIGFFIMVMVQVVDRWKTHSDFLKNPSRFYPMSSFSIRTSWNKIREHAMNSLETPMKIARLERWFYTYRYDTKLQLSVTTITKRLCYDWSFCRASNNSTLRIKLPISTQYSLHTLQQILKISLFSERSHFSL